MGSILCLPAQLACCFSGAAISVCSFCPSYSNSVNTRYLYGLIVLLCTLFASFMLLPGLENALAKVPFCTGFQEIVNVDCSKFAGFLAVYRICFVTAVFFFGMSLLTIGVRSSRDPRTGLQNGFWGVKFLLIFIGWIGAFFIQEGTFESFAVVFGMIGASLYIIVQVYLIIVFSNDWAERWLYNNEESDNKFWLIGIFVSCFGIFALSLTGVVLLYIHYTLSDDCALNKAIISVNLIFCVIFSIISILPTVQEYRESSGLLQSSMVTLYVVYLTWSSVASNPDSKCSPPIFFDSSQPASLSWDSRMGVVIWVIVFVCTSLRTASRAQSIVSDSETALTAEETLSNDEGDCVKYNWSLFHFFLGCSVLYVMMMLTNWGSPNSSLDTFRANAAAMRVKVITSWLCIILFNWWNVAPCLCPNRDFTE